MNEIVKYTVTTSLILISSLYITTIIYKSITILNFINSLFLFSLLLLITSLASIVLNSGVLQLFIISFRRIMFQEKEDIFQHKYNQGLSTLTKRIITSAGTLVIVTLVISLLL